VLGLRWARGLTDRRRQHRADAAPKVLAPDGAFRRCWYPPWLPGSSSSTSMAR
jgi:hypothetical protein